MTIRLGSNIGSLRAQRQLSTATSSAQKLSESLSAGLRINSASDDAAGLSIATSLTFDARIQAAAIRNGNDGISQLSIAQGALDALMSLVTRQMELAEQASSQGTLSTKQRSAMQSESDALTEEYNRVLTTTKFNDQRLFDPTRQASMIQLGEGTTNTIALDWGSDLYTSVSSGVGSSSTSAAVGVLPRFIGTGDFNNDGRVDFVSSNRSDGTVSLSFGNGDGTFQASSVIYNYGAGFSISEIVVRDNNNDGQEDIMIASPVGVLALYGNSNGTFQPIQTLTSGLAQSIDFGDFNNDGLTDILQGTNSSGTNYVNLANGDGTYRQLSITTRASNQQSTIADFNNDGRLDIVVPSNGATLGITLYMGNGDGTFSSEIALYAGNASEVQAGDFNRDGWTDLVGATNSGLLLYLNDGSGTLVSQGFIGGAGFNVEVADLNGDGFLDLASHNGPAGSSTAIVTYLGNGDGTFGSITTGPNLGQQPRDIAFADLNGDGALDILTGTESVTSLVSVMLSAGIATTNKPRLNIMSADDARASLTAARNTLQQVQSTLGKVGSLQSRLNVAISNLQSMSMNYKEAASRIMDVDVAAAASNLTRQKILGSIATSVLVQANAQPSLALQLLKS